MVFRGARAGIFDGLFAAEEDMTEADMVELAKALRDALAPSVETGVFARLGGGPRMVPARLGGADLGAVAGLELGMAEFDGVFARGGAAFDAEAYSSSRYRWPWTRKGLPYSSSYDSRVSLRSYYCQYYITDSRLAYTPLRLWAAPSQFAFASSPLGAIFLGRASLPSGHAPSTATHPG